MSSFESIKSAISSKNYPAVAVLYGEEPFFLKELSKLFENNVVPGDAKDFNQHILYGKDTSMGEAIQRARALPMFSDRTLVMVREAQHLSKQLGELENYLDHPNPSAVLVFIMHQKSLDKRLKVVKRIDKEQLLFESKTIYENKVGGFLDDLLRSKGVKLSRKAKQLMLFSISTDLSRYEREIDKLTTAEPAVSMFDETHIERHVGIDRHYNVFELTKALSEGNHKKSASILGYFSRNTKDHPPIGTLAVLYPFFTKVFKLHTLSNTKDASRVLGISPYFLSEYQSAARNFPMKRITKIISSLRHLDMKCKGLGGAPGLNDQQIYQDIAIALL